MSCSWVVKKELKEYDLEKIFEEQEEEVPPDYMSLARYGKLTFEEYAKQYRFKLRLREWTMIAYFRVAGLRRIMNKLFKLGIYLRLEKQYNILPIVGENHWSRKDWKEFKKSIDTDQRRAISEMLSKLSEVGDKPMYSKSCANAVSCECKIDTSCYLSDCKYAAGKFDEKIRAEYEKINLRVR